MRLKLDVSDPAAHLRALEACVLFPDAAESRALRRDLAAIYAYAETGTLTKPLQNVVETLNAVSDMNAFQAAVCVAQSAAVLRADPERQTDIAAFEAACLVLKVAALAAVHPAPQASAFHSTWIAKSLENEVFRRVALLAEKMIFFEHWAHQTEPRLSCYPKGDLIPSGLDAEASALIDAPEAHAWNGTGGQP
ncbi:hypothetical protein [Roseovarius pelagicus]|uniref:Uncharacterized protein n=1 Tax=Roseovarius pelagicus TaxID=2980108 RepID=A0ABY6DCC5_9RHOB|nr:hypothetical protein [Roseovarius pelagicus]UXX83796.1 hypothetical protein N7U68_03810 [Roseovarius pelagicus]